MKYELILNDVTSQDEYEIKQNREWYILFIVGAGTKLKPVIKM